LELKQKLHALVDLQGLTKELEGENGLSATLLDRRRRLQPKAQCDTTKFTIN